MSCRKLNRLNPDATESRREGLEETITIDRLGIGATLAKTLTTPFYSGIASNPEVPKDIASKAQTQPTALLPSTR